MLRRSGEEALECDRHEAVERRARLLDPGAQEPALIGVEEKGREIGRVGRARYGAIRLGVPNGVLDVPGPQVEKRSQPPANERAVIGKLRAEIAEQTPASIFEIRVHLIQAREMTPEPFQGGKRFVSQGLALRILSRVALDDLGAERLLAGEVVVEGARRRGCRVGDVPYATSVEALLRKVFSPASTISSRTLCLAIGHHTSDVSDLIRTIVLNVKSHRNTGSPPSRPGAARPSDMDPGLGPAFVGTWRDTAQTRTAVSAMRNPPPAAHRASSGLSLPSRSANCGLMLEAPSNEFVFSV